jgi:hypothetical protein
MGVMRYKYILNSLRFIVKLGKQFIAFNEHINDTFIGIAINGKLCLK